MSQKTKRHATGAACLLGLVLGALLLAQAHSVRADHTGRLTLQSVQDHVDDLADALAATCGNDIGEFGEICDGADLHGNSCQSEGFVYGTLVCAGSCTLDTSGCTDERFEDLGLTVCDRDTGLEWEKKTDDGTVHDKDNQYTWSTGSPWDPTGAAYTEFLRPLNATQSSNGSTVTGGFAGHNDWRLPEIDELGTILDCSFGNPCIDPIFGPTVSAFYWSASSGAGDTRFAWNARFNDGFVFNSFKTIIRQVRAVRAGSCN